MANEQLGKRRVALVTGSTAGIGANIAIDLVKEGYHVIITGRNVTKLLNVEQKCQLAATNSNSSGRAYQFVADLEIREQLDALIEFTKIKFNRLDILVNNACFRGKPKNIVEYEGFKDLQRVMNMNVFIPMYLIHKCLIPLRTRIPHKAILINISSIASQVVVPLHAYSISKSCLSELSRQVAMTAKELNIITTTISPGPILTEGRPHQLMSKHTLMNRVGTTQEIADLVTFVVSNAHLFNGQELFIDGGYLAKQKHT